MEKILALLKSKKFWTLVAAIVAALAAFFTTSCSASAKVQRSGIHIDTVRVDYIIRSRNASITASCQTDQFSPIQSISTPKSCLSTPAFSTFTESVTITSFLPVISNGFLIPLTLQQSDCNRLSSRSNSMRLISFTTPIPFCLAMAPQFSSKPSSSIFGEKCLALLLPIAFPRKSRRRGGRRGRPRPSGTKTVTLGGSHL
ncbi:hypothetical protein [Alistipes sp.]|uniref:hypothetical protein n=1 Tax=Alistipes sp. TaxID=1872444 RepID=UPI003AF0E4D4